MWAITLVIFAFSSILAEMTVPGIDRQVPEGVKSMGYKVVYGDEDMSVMNQVVHNDEKWNKMVKDSDIYHVLPPLPAEDVKCLMSVDRYCTKAMGEIKSILISSLKDDCAKCSTKEKESAGKIVSSMMAHDPVAWKIFLTRSALQILPRKKLPKEEKPKFNIIGEPEYIENTKNRYTMPGVKVRVKRYAMERIN